MTMRILIADDHALMREGLKCLLAHEMEVDVVADVADGRQAVEAAREHRPDLVIMDLSMPGMNGVLATQQIRQELPDVHILALSMYSNQKLVRDVLTAGANGYILKKCAMEELASAVATIRGGRRYISPQLVPALARAGDREDYPHARPALSDREREVLQLVAEGKSTKEMAALLHVTVKTIEKHRHNIMQKLSIHRVADLTKYAIREGITSVDH